MSSVHELIPIHSDIQQPSDRKFGFSVGGVLVGLFAVKWLLTGSASAASWILGSIGVALVAAALAYPASLGVPNRLWSRFGALLFYVMNPVVMLVIYVTTFIPIGLFLRMRHYDPLTLDFDRSAETYWVDRRQAEEATDMRNQF